MKFIMYVLILTSIGSSFSDCEWSKPEPIRNDEVLFFQECKLEGKVKVGEFILEPNIYFEIHHQHWPEGNTIWSKFSPNNERAIVYLENNLYQRNTWLLNLVANEIEFFSDHVEGRHYGVSFLNDEHFVITHGGLGYKVDYHYEFNSGEWVNTLKVNEQ